MNKILLCVESESLIYLFIFTTVPWLVESYYSLSLNWIIFHFCAVVAADFLTCRLSGCLSSKDCVYGVCICVCVLTRIYMHA